MGLSMLCVTFASHFMHHPADPVDHLLNQDGDSDTCNKVYHQVSYALWSVIVPDIAQIACPVKIAESAVIKADESIYRLYDHKAQEMVHHDRIGIVSDQVDPFAAADRGT